MTKIKKEVEASEPTLQPLGDKVLILPDVNEEKQTASGIIVPGAAQNIIGTVVAIGPGTPLESGEGFRPVDLTYGDRVLLGQYGHEEVNFGGKKYYLAPEGTILAVIN